MKFLEKTKLEDILNKLSETAEVFVPMARENESGFFSWNNRNKDHDKLILDSLNTYMPPKNVVFPQTEKMYNIKTNGQDVSIDKTYEDSNPKILFGVRACDAKAIFCLDEVFLTRGYVDSLYNARRENTIIIANACYEPGSNCFCTSMDVDPTEPENADIIIRDTGTGYIWEIKTDKGDKITEIIADELQDQELSLPKVMPFKRNVPYEGLPEKLKGMFEHPVWDKLSEACQTCGICTYVCPTCYCFDIQVKMWGDEGYRFRCYDSCMYSEYTMMAGGHNPRPTTKEKFRNRFLHKLEFFYERYGRSLCTGCGRCIAACPNGISIARVIEELKEADPDA